ncbi:MAG: M23 family metallopeptidase [Tannerella sp.]|jgi:murein DD-endopeptidase MepM/ murein hydrolase activator NlpD|nr:M23 family metallopeptidase [Tannerella sp.]
MNKIFVAIVAFLSVTMSSIQTEAQRLANPFDFPIQLSGGFCDLRAHHYHAGIDIRTKSGEGHAMHAVQKGYISRVSVRPWEYGLAIYITHPDDNLITVYGHLQKFNHRIAEIVKEKQYENENYSVDIKFEPDIFPIKQGDLIGYSGNSGSSGGPHLHFEVRDMQTGEWIDPLIFYKSDVPDTCKPLVRGLKIYPTEGKGMVNGNNKKQNIEFKLDKNDQPVIAATIEAWGEIGLGIRAVDRMDGTGFSYGIKDILLTVDSVEMFRSHADRFSPEESKYINSYTDYEEWSDKRIFYIKTFVDPGNRTQFIASRNSGKININEERIYNILITLTDIYGNTSKVPMKIKGKKQDITPPDAIGAKLMRWYDYNAFSAKGVRLTIPLNSLYNSIHMRYDTSFVKEYFSLVHTLHNSPVPLHTPAQLSIRIDSSFTSTNTDQFGIVRITNSNGKTSWIGGAYHDGWIDAEISELGTYTVTRDSAPPVIRPIDPGKWREKKKISIRITDDLSGVSIYRGEIDGKYALFEYDGKNALITYTFDNERLHPGYHRLKLTVTDRRGNKSTYEYSFTW